MILLDPVRGPGLYVNQQTRKREPASEIGVADAPHGTHLARQVRNGRGFIGRVEHVVMRKTGNPLARTSGRANIPEAGRFATGSLRGFRASLRALA
jgi:hypothetical protein